ncbi:uncharacterized protein PV06_11689 [Exophiala oligosperma]|uniref:Xylanolytic transcriptional activator regulatory domain-containing protein n=1 Tax=Exophiala oligosperma TaxID=215243 RepID=A0A0D2DK07_9EURO|nr:uncharacterized protein PV06_11689 [Exophiala oligosperma]KIW36014.1 hypothetical protein PV06_11689 [Exophiala oligosperma]
MLTGESDRRSHIDHEQSCPCENCYKAGVECVPATSNRGRTRRQSHPQQAESGLKSFGFPHSRVHFPASDQVDSRLSDQVDLHLSDRTFASVSPTASLGGAGERRGGTDIDGIISAGDLHGTADILNFVQSITGASTAADSPNGRLNVYSKLASPHVQAALDPVTPCSEYFLISSGQLTFPELARLLERFAEVYCPYYPIIPRKALCRENLANMANCEPVLLTAMITIAAQDIRGANDRILQSCSQYMQILLGEIMLGIRCKVDALEATLLLAEWEPQYSLLDSTARRCGGEDTAAFMHIGLALRIASFLDLEQAFPEESKKPADQITREALAYVACFLSDRQISIRTGRQFGFHGTTPAFLARLLLFADTHRRNVKCKTSNADQAKILEARLELTSIYSEVHQHLYRGQIDASRTLQDQICDPRLNEFRTAMTAWKTKWGGVDYPTQVKIQLDLSFEYLRLYANAFVFRDRAGNHDSCSIDQTASGLSSTDDFFLQSLDAAKTFLAILNNHIPPGNPFNYLPIRFLLYAVNCAVLLYKILTLKIVPQQEIVRVHVLVRATIKRLKQSSLRPSDLASHYGHLLDFLWSTERYRLNPDPDLSSTSEPFPTRRSDVDVDLENTSSFVSGDTTGVDLVYSSQHQYRQDRPDQNPDLNYDILQQLTAHDPAWENLLFGDNLAEDTTH